MALYFGKAAIQESIPLVYLPKAADLENHLDSWHIKDGPGLCTVPRE